LEGFEFASGSSIYKNLETSNQLDSLSNEDKIILYKAFAENNDSEMQFKLGTIYSDGKMIEKNYEIAKEWYSKACNNKDSNKNRKAYIKVISFILILQSGLRNVAVGADTYGYYISFQNTINKSWLETYNVVLQYYSAGIGKDPGYMVVEKICSSFIPNYQVFLFVIAIIFFSGLGSFLYKNTTKFQDVIIAFVIYSVLFYSFFSITGQRQTIATGIVFFAFDFMKRNKILFFVILILLASTIHKSSLIFFLLFFLSKLNSSKIPFYFSFLLFPLFFIIKSNVIFYIQNLLGYQEYEQIEGAGLIHFQLFFCSLV
jgi:transmembrane protein EpsG